MRRRCAAVGLRGSILRGNYCGAGKYNAKAALACAHVISFYFFILIQGAFRRRSHPCRLDASFPLTDSQVQQSDLGDRMRRWDPKRGLLVTRQV